MYEPCSPGDCYILDNVNDACFPELKLNNGTRIQNFFMMIPIDELNGK